MSKAFWVIAAGWIAGVIVSAPSAFRGSDIGLAIPGTSPAGSEFIVTTMLAIIPPLLAALVIQSRRKKK